MNFKKLFLITLLLGVSGHLHADPAQEDLPELLDVAPQAPFDILTPIGAGKKTIQEAREELRKQAKKVNADAVTGVHCEPGGMGRDGLNFYKKDAYCKGFAIRLKNPPAH